MTILGLKMIIFGHFSRFLTSFKISFSGLQNVVLLYRQTRRDNSHIHKKTASRKTPLSILYAYCIRNFM